MMVGLCVLFYFTGLVTNWTSWRGRLDPWEGGSPNGTPLGDGYQKIRKKSTQPRKKLSFRSKNKNRPTYCDFEIYNFDPKLHQIFKPIRLFFRNNRIKSQVYINTIFNIYKFQEI